VAPREEVGVPNFDYDGVVIGWGFGGSVAALRAVEG
jgi:pyruvate/2-oxoglutarate dehydrogenase complex dihydrolipoamide dehydrogenase (E3) component